MATNNEAATSSSDTPQQAVFRIHIRAPIQEVWAHLTRTDSVLPFFFNGTCRTPGLEPGAPMRMVTKDGKYTSVAGEVIEFEPPYRYAHTFKFTNLDDPACVVRYVLRETDEGTEFTLIHENVPAGSKSEKYMTQGADFITKNLKAVVETGKPTLSGRLLLGMISLMAPFTPKSSLSENWPFDKRVR